MILDSMALILIERAHSSSVVFYLPKFIELIRFLWNAVKLEQTLATCQLTMPKATD